MVIGLDERLLHQVLCVLPLPSHLINVIVEPTAVRVDDPSDRPGFPGRGVPPRGGIAAARLNGAGGPRHFRCFAIERHHFDFGCASVSVVAGFGSRTLTAYVARPS